MTALRNRKGQTTKSVRYCRRAKSQAPIALLRATRTGWPEPKPRFGPEAVLGLKEADVADCRQIHCRKEAQTLLGGLGTEPALQEGD